MTRGDHDDDVARGADTRIDDRDVHGAAGKYEYARASQNPASAGQYTGTSCVTSMIRALGSARACGPSWWRRTAPDDRSPW